MKLIDKKWGLVALLATCAPVPLGNGDRREVAGEIVANVIEPTLDDVVVRATAMRDAMRTFASAPVGSLHDAARQAWIAARVPWKHTDAFAFGPAEDQRLGVAIDQRIDTPKIDEELAGTAEFTPAYVANLGANKKGFHAIEYLVFGDLASFTTDPLASRRTAMLVALADDLVVNTTTLRDAWAGEYGNALAEPGRANATYQTIASVIDELVNQSVFLVELVAKARLGKPLGMDIGGTAQPELEESGFADNSIQDMRDAIAGVRAIYDGGIGSLVAKQSPVIDRHAREGFDAAIAALNEIPKPYKTALVQHRMAVENAYARVIELERVLGTEVLGVLGATLKFNDNDGD